METILIRDGSVSAPLPNYDEEVDPLIEPTETQTEDMFPPLTVEEGEIVEDVLANERDWYCLLYTSPSPRDQRGSRMPSSA